jgi:1,4-alpha-glucan branching enzyme
MMIQKKYFKKKDECEVTFEHMAEGAKEVQLVGEFNQWSPIAMKKDKSGTFRTKVRLPKDGRFQYRYLVDGEIWANDEAADAYVPNEHGSNNSVVETHSAS